MNSVLKVYFKLPHDKSFGVFSKVINRLIAKALKIYLDRKVPSFFLKTQDQFKIGINQEKKNHNIIVSLTSFPGRITDVWIVIECIFRQSIKADKIILWLSKSQFEGLDLPKNLLEQVDRGLEINFVDYDLRSHKKYYYALEKYADSIIITIDDDVYYHENVLSTLYESYVKHPNCVIANRAHKITFDEKTGVILPYQKWQHNIKEDAPSFLYVPTGVGGVLYPPKSLSNKLLNPDVIKNICFHADDLWLKAGSLIADTKVITTKFYKQEFITIGKTQNSKLVTSNSLNGGNDIQIKKI
jgi:hypothetical protein